MALTSWFALAGCDGGRGGEGPPIPENPSVPNDLSELIDRVTPIPLQEPGGQVLGSPVHVAARPGEDRLLIVDGLAHQIRLHDMEGRLLAIRGVTSGGDAPGEFTRPIRADWTDDGRIVVAEFNRPRLTFLRADLELDQVQTLEDVSRVVHLATGTDATVLVARRRLEEGVIDVRTYEGEVLRTVHREHPLITEAPYWNEDARTTFDESRGRIAVAMSMVYPLSLHSLEGEPISDDFGHPPASWRQASIPERGAFAFTDPSNPVMSQDPIEWRRSFTRIDRVAFLGRNCLVVSHRDPHPDVPGLARWTHRVDVYHLGEGIKLVEDADLPGALLGRDADALFVLDGDAPDPAWGVLRMELRDDSPCGR